MSHSYVYLIARVKAERFISPIKIGISDAPYARVLSLQTNNPYHIDIVETWRCQSKTVARRFESALHNDLSEYRTRGEWFEYSPTEALKLCREWLRVWGDFETHQMQERGCMPLHPRMLEPAH